MFNFYVIEMLIVISPCVCMSVSVCAGVFKTSMWVYEQPNHKEICEYLTSYMLV